MFMIDEKDKEYRFGDSGPKYLMKGPAQLRYRTVSGGPDF